MVEFCFRPSWLWLGRENKKTAGAWFAPAVAEDLRIAFLVCFCPAQAAGGLACLAGSSV
jgi:hypothetical protein